MAKIQYQKFRFTAPSLEMIDQAIAIVDEYVEQGFVLTVRQLYYQLVARDIIPNNERSYKRTTCLINDARLAGLIDWDAIEDRTRAFEKRNRWESSRSFMRAAANAFHMDMWENQKNRVFVIVEKEALSNVFSDVCHRLDMPLLAARGYPSASVLQEFGHRLRDIAVKKYSAEVDTHGKEYAKRNIQRVIILHLGDHDPSGIDMTRDLRERIKMFTQNCVPFDLQRIALNMEQIEEQQPPPNPAKTTDARFANYQAEHGDESWELDALSPSYLSGLVEKIATAYIDKKAWKERAAVIEEKRERLTAFASSLEKGA